jgi:hypothetical protein
MSKRNDEGTRDAEGNYIWYCGNGCGTQVDYQGWICHECADAGAPQPKWEKRQLSRQLRTLAAQLERG